MVRRLIPCLAALALLVAAPAASARVTTLGSDLKGDANLIEDHGADSAFWPVDLATGQPAGVPAGGQVTSVRVKGTVLRDPRGQITPIPMIHFQTLHPMGDGSVRVELSSAPFYVPIGGDPNVISTYKPVNMCLNRGDVLDFNDIGGNQWHWGPYSGMPFQTFSRVPTAATAFYTKDRGTNNGARFAPMQLFQGEELLMQMTFASGPDATDTCPGGYKQHVFKGLDLRGGNGTTLRTKTQTITTRTICPGPTYGACRGVIRAVATLNGQSVTLGSKSFSSRPSSYNTLEIPVAAGLVATIKKLGSVPVRLVAASRDNPSTDDRVYRMRALPRQPDDVVPVQRRTTATTVTLSPDVPFYRKNRR